MPKIELIQGDCLEKMKDIPDGGIDMVLTSPPYDTLRTYNGSLDWGEHIWKPVIKELFRIIKDGGVVVWVVGDATIKGSETGTSFKQALYFKEIGFNLHDTMIYQKNSYPFPPKNRYYQQFEYMFVFSKNAPKTYNIQRQPTDPRWRNKDNKSSDKVAYGHSAIFPDELAKRHILTWSNEGDTILDPFAGSGTVGKMAKQLNRNCILIEKDPAYCEIAEKRINIQTDIGSCVLIVNASRRNR